MAVDYPGATTAADKVDLIVGHYPSMYAVYLLTYVAFGIAVGALALTRWERLRLDAPTTVRFATAIGLMWAVALVTSGLIFTPPLNDATVAFGLLQIVWFAWLGGALLVTKATARPDHSSTVDDRRVPLTEVAR